MTKLLHPILLLCCTLLTTLSHAEDNPIKQQLLETAKSHYLQTKNNQTLNGSDKAYQFSMPLLASATLQDQKLYQQIRNEMQLLLLDKKNFDMVSSPMRAWMLGRMTHGALLIDDTKSLPELKYRLLSLLKNNTQQDPLTGWAWAYLLASDKKLYSIHRNKLRDYTGYSENADKRDKDYATNLMWTLTMNLYAAALSQNRNDYAYFLQKISGVSTKSSLVEAVKLVPESDYRYWLTSLCRLSFVAMGDHKNINEISKITYPENGLDNFNLDLMLAMSNDISIETLQLVKATVTALGSH